MFGPYYTYWVDDHNTLNSSILAAYESELIVPFAMNVGYCHYISNTKWRPEIGLQYSYLLTQKKQKTSSNPNGISILLLLPGVQFQWDNTLRNAQGNIWLAFIFDKNRMKKNLKSFLLVLTFLMVINFADIAKQQSKRVKQTL